MAKEFNWEEISFGIITYVGMAKSNAIMAIREAKEKNYDEALRLLEEAEKEMINAEKMHMDVISEEAGGTKIDFKVLFMHAEDQLLTTQAIMVLAKEMIDMYKQIHGVK
ncbi:PTS system, cellobiose-specific IIA component [Spiroplasma helicoides]|uniref:PTS system, cellobiose-specific IIA component n=1 Tax=Spiroplasma helicoides TaxID=216938 RepID=A0A1B3SJP6_9MOLU|nr:PTS lactose/cellobiose transporter subunit IIA [Spiroplasma helicoides]AOG60154.1 PTS system, cellobiose-specific IIA component [Spiroplasma helicoides]